MTAVSRRTALSLLPGALAVAAAREVVGDSSIEGAALPEGVRAASALDIEPVRVWQAPNQQPITGLTVFNGKLYVSAGPDLYVSERA